MPLIVDEAFGSLVLLGLYSVFLSRALLFVYLHFALFFFTVYFSQIVILNTTMIWTVQELSQNLCSVLLCNPYYVSSIFVLPNFSIRGDAKWNKMLSQNHVGK